MSKRVYKFTSARHAIDNVKNQRIKLSTIDDLNDPFDLCPLDTTDPACSNALDAVIGALRLAQQAQKSIRRVANQLRLVVLRGRLPGRSPRFSSRAATPLRAILEIAFAHIHSRFRTYHDLCSRFRSWRPERQQSLHCRPTALRCRPISLASRRRTAAPPRVSRQSRHERRRVDHHVPCAPDAGGQSSRSPGATE